MGDYVYLVIRRKKRSIYLEALSSTNIAEIKKMLEGIIKVPTYNQRLFLNMNPEEEMEDVKDLMSYGITGATSKPASPVYLGLCIKIEDGSFEPLLIIPYSIPPEFADVMKMTPPNVNTEETEEETDATKNPPAEPSAAAEQDA